MAHREEESLIDDMRATIRADRERAAARAPKPAQPPEPPAAPEAAAPEPVQRPTSRLRKLLGR
jgi:hypothetical protein